MHTYAFIFGRNGRLSELELRAIAPRFGLSVTEVAEAFAFVAVREALSGEQLLEAQGLLGGTTRIVEVLAATDLEDAATAILKRAGDGKITIGITVAGGTKPPHKLAKPLKERLREAGRSVRIVTPQPPATALNAGTLLHNKLIGTDRGFELFIVQAGGKPWYGLTQTCQDVEDYTKRDLGIPKPDALSGMLPPKLAQILLNLAVGGEDLAVYDPFCGNGRILLEGALRGLPVYGSDLREQQVAATQENLEWQAREYGSFAAPDRVWQADATAGPGREIGQKFVIVTEPYLGKPLRAPLLPEQKTAWLSELVPLFEQFFGYWSTAAERPERFIVIFPRARVADGTEASVFDALVDRLHQIGYSTEALFCYDRADSMVRRDIVALNLSSVQ